MPSSSEIELFLRSIEHSIEGKKFLLCIYYAISDTRVVNTKIREYLEKLIDKNDISHLLLSSRAFKYGGTLINMFAFSTFLRSYIGESDKELYSVKTEEQIRSMTFEEIAEYFDDIDKDDLQYGIQIGNPASGYIWVTNEPEHTVKPENLGLESDTYRIAIVFPEEDRDLYKPTAIEAYGNKVPNGNEWFFADMNSSVDWGCAISIVALGNVRGATVPSYTSIVGSNEALMKKESLTKDHTPFLVKSEIHGGDYNPEKSAFGSFTTNEYNGRIISDIMSAI